MSWRDEFGPSYEIPVILDFLAQKGFLIDTSWHNDMMPSFSVIGYRRLGAGEKPPPISRGRRKAWDPRVPLTDVDPTVEVRLWVDHPIMSQRENVDTPRFGVMVGEPASDIDGSWQFHEVEAAIVQAFKVVMEKGAAFVWEPAEWNKVIKGGWYDPEDLAKSLIDDYYDRT